MVLLMRTFCGIAPGPLRRQRWASTTDNLFGIEAAKASGYLLVLLPAMFFVQNVSGGIAKKKNE